MTKSLLSDQLQRPLRDLRLSVLDQCNYRCPYCMPADTFHDGYAFLTRNQRLSFAEIETVARAAVALGVEKLRLTGGEPLLRKGLPDLVARLASIEGVQDLALTTNAQLLAPMAQRLADAGLSRITVSLDSLDADVFKAMSGGRGDIKAVLAGIDAAAAAGMTPIKINVVVQKGVNDHTVLSLLDHFRGTGHIVRLIEYMDVGNRNGWRMEHVVSAADLLTLIKTRWDVQPISPGYTGEVARRYAYADGAGEIGFITSVTQPFCGDCHRARLSADGVVYTCLFASSGTSLREQLREGGGVDEMIARLTEIWGRRDDRYSERRSSNADVRVSIDKVEMYRVGG